VGLGLTLLDGETDGESEDDGETDGESDDDGETLDDGLTLALADGDSLLMISRTAR
jgi:hypothetical protein